MNRLAVRLTTAALVAGGVAFALAPMPASAESSAVKASTEAWYQPDPSCSASCVLTTLPGEVSGQLVTNPYPAGTLHVGYAAGKETARSVLAFSLDDLTGALTGATLDVPLDVDPANGDAQSATAKVQVCLVTGDITKVEGSVATPPSTSCDTHATMTYVATPAPHLTADLAPILLGLPTTNGIALLPDATDAAETDAWHVTFSAHDRTGGTTGPATLTVTTADPTAEVPAPTLPPVAEAPTVPVSGGFAPAPDTGFVAGPPVVDAPVSAPVEAPQVPAPAAAPAQVPAAQTITFGYAYPAVWLLPLVFLILVPAAARALTKPLDPVPLTGA